MYFCNILFRTIKPNETKRPRDWEHQRVMHQVLSPILLKNVLQQDKYFLSFRLNILDLRKTCGYEGRVLHTEDLLISLLKGQKLTKVSNSPKLIILLKDACILIFASVQVRDTDGGNFAKKSQTVTGNQSNQSHFKKCRHGLKPISNGKHKDIHQGSSLGELLISFLIFGMFI